MDATEIEQITSFPVLLINSQSEINSEIELPFHSEVFKELQIKDRNCIHLKQLIQQNDPKAVKKFTIINGVLYFKL